MTETTEKSAEKTGQCECCGADGLLVGYSSPHDPDGEWVTSLTLASEWVPGQRDRVLLCQNCSVTEYLAADQSTEAAA